MTLGDVARAAVDAAIRARKVAPAQRPWAEAYAMKDPEGFTTYVEKTPELFSSEIGSEADAPSPVDDLFSHAEVDDAIRRGDLAPLRRRTHVASVARHREDLRGKNLGIEQALVIANLHRAAQDPELASHERTRLGEIAARLAAPLSRAHLGWVLGLKRFVRKRLGRRPGSGAYRSQTEFERAEASARAELRREMLDDPRIRETQKAIAGRMGISEDTYTRYKKRQPSPQ